MMMLKKLKGWKTRLLMASGCILIILIQLGYLDAANYDRVIQLLTMLGMVTLHSAVTRNG